MEMEYLVCNILNEEESSGEYYSEEMRLELLILLLIMNIRTQHISNVRPTFVFK